MRVPSLLRLLAFTSSRSSSAPCHTKEQDSTRIIYSKSLAPLRLPFASQRARFPAPPRVSPPKMLASLLLPLLLLPSALGVKFSLQAHHSPAQKCLWNYAMADTLVVISVSAPLQGAMQRLDMEVVDGSGSRNIYQSKKGLKGETRMAVTTHADADLGVCFKNVLDPCKLANSCFAGLQNIELALCALSRAVTVAELV